MTDHKGLPTPATDQGAVAGVGTTYELEVPLMLHPNGGKLAEPLNANWRLDRWTVASRVRTVREAVVMRAINAKIPQCQHLTVTLHYAPGDNRNRDADNLWPTLKAACDALAKGKRREFVGLDLVPDDTPEFMEKLTPVIHKGKGRIRLWLEVTVDR